MFDNYVTVSKERGGNHRGEIRNIFTGALWECEHRHGRISAARECAEKHAKAHGIELEPNYLGAR